MFLLFFFLSVYIIIVNVRLQLQPNRYSSVSVLECGCPTVCLYLCLVDGQFIFRQIVRLLNVKFVHDKVKWCRFWKIRVSVHYHLATTQDQMVASYISQRHSCDQISTWLKSEHGGRLAEWLRRCSDSKRPKLQRTVLAPLFDFILGFDLRQSWHKIFRIAFETMGK